jgi:4-hydroxy-tetrahydrodipicolinate synthase
VWSKLIWTARIRIVYGGRSDGQLTLTAFRGTYTVLITPFSADGAAVDVLALTRLVNWQIEQGIHGLIPLGSTGEFLSLTAEEREQVIETCVRESAGRVPVLIGTGAEWTREAVHYARQAERMGADGILVIPPFYSSPTEDELFEHYRRIAEATALPIMLYNNPATANVDLLPATVARLSRIDNVRYIKESTLEVTRVRDIIELCGDRMTVFAGILGYESFWLGAQGWVAVCSNLLPRASARRVELVAAHHNQRAALALYREILPIIRWVGGHRYVAASKAALEMMGLSVGLPRPPRLPLPLAEAAHLSADLDALGLLNSLRTGSGS